MAKKLIYNYRFDASAKTITMGGKYALRTFQLVTNVTDNIIIYNFADSAKGGSASYNSVLNETILTLSHNTTSMSDDDEIQIFVDLQENKVEFGETFTDPVSKLRVSTPENLIDTDFEYGLQPTKWETVELVNNIPSAYTRAPGVSIFGITQVLCINNSEVINVEVSEEHGLSIGDPIEVRGLNSRTANGKYLITQIPTTTSFNYKATAIQSFTGNLRTAYTTIIPGSFFTGSSIEYDKFEGINTDAANPSTLTIKNDYAHGFSTNTSLYITNTVGKKELILSQTTNSTAPDSSPYVNPSDDSFYLPLHGLYNNQVITLSAGTGGAVPTTDTEAVEPTSSSVASAVYAAAETVCNSFASTFKNDQDHSRILMNYTGSGTYYTYDDVTINPNASYGTNIEQEMRWGAAYSYNTFANSQGSAVAQYYYNPLSVGPTTLYTGTAVDIGQYMSRRRTYGGATSSNYPANLSNMGFYHVSTPYSYNQYTDYILEVHQIPNFDKLDEYRISESGNSNYDADRFYESNSEYRYKEQTLSGSKYVYEVSSPVTYNSTWEYTYCITYINAGSGEMSMYTIDVWLMNTAWTDYYSVNNQNIQNGFVSDLTANNRAYLGSRWHIQAVFGLDDGHQTTNGGRFRDSNQAATRAASIATGVADALTSIALSDGDDVKIEVVNDNRIKIKTVSNGAPYDITNNGTAPINFVTGQTFGIADDYYNITGVTTFTTSISANSRLAARTLEFADTDFVQDSDTSIYYINFPGGHGISDGQKVTYNKVSGGDPYDGSGPFVSGTEYYAYTPNSEHVGLSTNESDFLSNVYVQIINEGPGSYNLQISSISGRVAAAGTVTTSSSSKVITGVDTKFTSAYSIGDTFILDPPSTYGEYVTATVASVVSDTSLSLENNAGITTDGVKHFVDTKMNVRADGTFIHRPFDGGVEITAGSSPDSKVIRQTRKYFRYQSGKGIQCSMAINFNPYRPARTLLGTPGSSNAIITTEYPHGLTVGNNIKIKNAELKTLYTPTDASYDPDTGILTITISNHGFLVGEYVTIAENSFIFTCSYDNYATEHPYPRRTDPAGGLARLQVTKVDTNTFEVNVGVSQDPNTGAHIFQSGTENTNAVTHIDTSNIYNGARVVSASDTFTFAFNTSGIVTSNTKTPGGFIEYTISNYTDAGIRGGLFDDQNGMFYEYDGSVLYAVRRSSTSQLAGTVQTIKNSNVINGTNTRFLDQLNEKDYIVVRGQSYKITRIVSDTNLEIQPKYRGSSNMGIIVTKTEDLKVPQHLWSIDPADGTGPSGYALDINSIQMVYMDYSWYGAGKIRFGFKDINGHVKYVHEFIHNNKLNEAYMRTGNVPARYEAFNIGEPTYIPGLFHWGTSVIMDGGFDDDDSYLFTGSGKTLSFTNGDADTSTANADGTLYDASRFGSQRAWYLRLSFPSTDASKFSNGIPLYTSNSGGLSGETVSFTDYSGSNFRVYIFLGIYGRSGPAVYPSVPNTTVVNIGAPSSGDTSVDLTTLIPLVSLRLAPSVDNNLIGSVGERDIINRMQLKLNELGISVSHDSRISVILNGALSNIAYSNVGSPSLSQYVAHDYGDTIQDGTAIYQFRASGGAIGSSGERTVASQAFDLSRLIDMGNSILGGDGVFPNGPDIITICSTVLDTSTVNKTSPYQVSSRISWAESQA